MNGTAAGEPEKEREAAGLYQAKCSDEQPSKGESSTEDGEGKEDSDEDGVEVTVDDDDSGVKDEYGDVRRSAAAAV